MPDERCKCGTDAMGGCRIHNVHTMRALEQEIAGLREGFASEARIVLAQTLDVKALGKGRRRILREQVERMANVALGKEQPRSCIRGRQTLEEYVEYFIKRTRMPRVGGYSIYVAPVVPEGHGWVLRLYRDSDDTHIHSAEEIPLDVGLKEIGEALIRDGARQAIAASQEERGDAA